MFARDNDNGEVVDGPTFDANTGIARIPKELCDFTGVRSALQMQLLVPCKLESLGPYRVRWAVENSRHEVLDAGWLESDAFSYDMQVPSDVLSSYGSVDGMTVIADGVSFEASLSDLGGFFDVDTGRVVLPLAAPMCAGVVIRVPDSDDKGLIPSVGAAIGSRVAYAAGVSADQMKTYPFGYVKNDPGFYVGQVFTFTSKFAHSVVVPSLWGESCERLSMIMAANGGLYAWNEWKGTGWDPPRDCWYPVDATYNNIGDMYNSIKGINEVTFNGNPSSGIPGFFGVEMIMIGQNGTDNYGFKDKAFWSTIKIPGGASDGRIPIDCVHSSQFTQFSGVADENWIPTTVRVRVLALKRDSTNDNNYIVLGFCTTEEARFVNPADPNAVNVQGGGAIYKFPLLVNGYATLVKGVSS